MSQTSGNHKSTDVCIRSKAEANARALNERADQTLGREPWTIHASDSANKQSGEAHGSPGRRGRGVTERSAPLWRPRPRIAQAELTKFSGFVAERFPEIDVSTYEALHQWSITSTTDFWRCIWDYSDVIASQESDEVVRDLRQNAGRNVVPRCAAKFCRKPASSAR